MKILKRIFIGIICIPVLMILFEIFGFIVNHIATNIQTAQLEKAILSELSMVEMIDTYSETGNTSGTGNHVDMLSVAVFKTEDTKTDIKNKLKNIYDFDDEFGCWVEELKESHEHLNGFSFWNKMDIPEDLDNCYMIYLNERAPFVDNIEGH
ncbi:MAG: hypothetical protein HFI90_08610 [Clostridia bacterium]|nr:hypothetical protein [Clostridia bacterium]